MDLNWWSTSCIQHSPHREPRHPASTSMTEKCKAMDKAPTDEIKRNLVPAYTYIYYVVIPLPLVLLSTKNRETDSLVGAKSVRLRWSESRVSTVRLDLVGVPSRRRQLWLCTDRQRSSISCPSRPLRAHPPPLCTSPCHVSPHEGMRDVSAMNKLRPN